jgi:hypothetical protein
MKILDPGHQYALASLDGSEEVVLTFVKRQGPSYPGNRGSHPGTTTQEVLRALIDRARYINGQIPCAETELSISLMETVVLLYEQRAARRHHRTLDIASVHDLDQIPTCAHCGHVACKGGCR